MSCRLTQIHIEKCKVFIAERPHYEINTKSETYCAEIESEKNECKNKIGW